MKLNLKIALNVLIFKIYLDNIVGDAYYLKQIVFSDGDTFYENVCVKQNKCNIRESEKLKEVMNYSRESQKLKCGVT